MIRGFACGVFDMFHAGHVMMLKECKENCDFLTIALNKADNIELEINAHKKPPLFSIEERVMILESCVFVDAVIVYGSEEELYTIMKNSRIDVRFLGEDYRGAKITGEDLGIPIHYTFRGHNLSTSAYKRKLVDLWS